MDQPAQTWNSRCE